MMNQTTHRLPMGKKAYHIDRMSTWTMACSRLRRERLAQESLHQNNFRAREEQAVGGRVHIGHVGSVNGSSPGSSYGRWEIRIIWNASRATCVPFPASPSVLYRLMWCRTVTR